MTDSISLLSPFIYSTRVNMYDDYPLTCIPLLQSVEDHCDNYELLLAGSIIPEDSFPTV